VGSDDHNGGLLGRSKAALVADPMKAKAKEENTAYYGGDTVYDCSEQSERRRETEEVGLSWHECVYRSVLDRPSFRKCSKGGAKLEYQKILGGTCLHDSMY